MLALFFILAAVQIDVVWLLVAGFCAALGAAMWKFIPWVVKTGLEEVIEAQVKPLTVGIEEKVTAVETKVVAVNERIDSHMDVEENSFDSIVNDMNAIRTRLDDRTLKFEKLQETLDDRSQLFDNLHATMERTQDVLTQHIAADESQFAASAAALTVGQEHLLARLAVIEENTKMKSKKRRSGE